MKNLLVTAIVHVANVQDRDGAPDLLQGVRHSFLWLRHVFADGAYAMAPMLATSWPSSCPAWATGPSRSYVGATTPKASRFYLVGGSSSARSPGSIGTGAWAKTSKPPSPRRKAGSSSPASSPSLVGSQEPDIAELILSQTLRVPRVVK